LHEAVNMANLFIPKGKEVVSTKGKVQEWNKSYKTLGNPLDAGIPLVVLTGEGSASASEIVAGSLQDYDRAVLIGSKTFGKGLVQTTRQLSYNSQLKVTTAKYYIPSGRCIQKLDYEHRDENGAAKAYADSLKAEFRTSNGRKVYDGGGLDPDITVDQNYVGTITAALFGNGLIFEYASKYCNENPTPTDFKNFKLSEKEYDAFAAWVKTQKFAYTTPLEKEVKQLIEAGKNEKYFSQIEGDLNALSSKIEANKAQDLKRFQDEINYLLSQQIAFHYGLNEAQNQVSITGDRAIAEAMNILKNQARYKEILSVN
jgi:carboxyl-terminal processing protease